MIDLPHITQFLLRRSEECFPACKTWSDSDWMLELLGEAGEAANVIKKMNRNLGDRDALHSKLEEELSDIFICLLLNAAKHGINLETAMPRKFNLDSDKLKTSIRIDPYQSINSMRVYGLTLEQIVALLRFYLKKTGTENVSLISNLSPQQILDGERSDG